MIRALSAQHKNRPRFLPSLRVPTTEALFATLSGCFFLVGAHFTFPNYGGYGLNLPQNYVAWVFIALLIGVGIWRWVSTRTLIFSQQMLWFWTGALILSLLLLDPRIRDLSLAIPRVTALLAGVLLYTTLLQFQSNRVWQSLLYWMLVATSIQSGLGLVQYFSFGPDNPLGYDAISNRPNGTFQQVNVMASFVATGLAIGLHLICSQPGQTRPRLLTLLIGFTAFSAPLLLVVIQSRTGQLAGCAVLLLMAPTFIQHFQSLKPELAKLTLLFALGLSSGIISLTVIKAEDSAQRGGSIYEHPGARTVIYSQSLAIIQSQPLLGVGYGNFESAWRTTYANQAETPDDLEQGLHGLNHPHNETLLWGVEGGALALFGLVLLAVGYLNTLRRLAWVQGLSFLALAAPILIHTQTEYPLYHSSLHWITLIVLLASADHARGAFKTQQTPHILLPGALAIAIPLITVPFMLTGLQSLAVTTQFEASKPKNYTLLLEVTNPAADLSRFQWHLWELRLKTALATGDREELNAFLDWSETRAQSMPRVALFIHQLIAQRALGKFDAADRTLANARFLFGDMPELLPFIDLPNTVKIRVE